MKICALLLASVGLCAAADGPATLTGVIGDDMCNGDHKAMGGTDAVKCTDECVKTMHAQYALWVGKDVYVLSDQKKPAQFVGKTVIVTGTLKGKDLQVKTIKAAK